jgi:DNA invertase Pin-like site-specific DNA recombinase
MHTLASLRVSRDAQDVTPPRLAVRACARQAKRAMDDCMAGLGSARRSPPERPLDVLLTRLQPDDPRLVSDRSRMGRSVGALMTRLDPLVQPHIPGVARTAGLRLEGRGDLQTRVMVTLIGLFAEIERELISLRTKEALPVTRAAGKRLGRPPGRQGHSKLDGQEADIRRFLGFRVSKASIAKITGVDRSILYHFIRSRRL